MADGEELARTGMTARNPNPSRAQQIVIVGQKRSGKTEIAYRLFESYPFDRIAVDPTGDLKMPEDTEELVEIPYRWPGTPLESVAPEPRSKRRTLHYVPEYGADDYAEQIDRAVGLAFNHRRTCLFVDEGHEAFPIPPGPHARRALRHSRHQDLTLIVATPRPQGIDTLVLSQADWGYFFKLRNPNDRKRVADSIGWDPKSFDEDMYDLGPHEYLRWDAEGDDLAHFPAMPEHLLKHHNDG